MDRQRFDLPDDPDIWICPECGEEIVLPCSVFNDNGMDMCEECFDAYLEDIKDASRHELTREEIEYNALANEYD
jgi:hypothetical protein